MSISIVMLSFNQVEFLNRAIHSVLNQELVELQLIIVDPGSTDGSRELAQRIASEDDRVILIFEPDSGPADGLNKGFARAKNEFVGYLNSDDVYLPSTLSLVEINFKSNAGADVIYGHGIILDERKQGKLQFAFSDKISTTKIRANTARIMQQSTFFRKESLDDSRILFNTKNITCWDFEFIVDSLIAGLRLVRVQEVFGILSIHSDSITGGNLNFQKYEADKNRIIGSVVSNMKGRTSIFHVLHSLGYRISRQVKIFVLRNRFQEKIKEFAKIENISFME